MYRHTTLRWMGLVTWRRSISARCAARVASACWPAARGLHSFTFQLNMSAFCETGGVFRGCLGVSRGIKGCPGCILCQKRLRLSSKQDECKPLPAACSSALRPSRSAASAVSSRLLSSVYGPLNFRV